MTFYKYLASVPYGVCLLYTTHPRPLAGIIYTKLTQKTNIICPYKLSEKLIACNMSGLKNNIALVCFGINRDRHIFFCFPEILSTFGNARTFGQIRRVWFPKNAFKKQTRYHVMSCDSFILKTFTLAQSAILSDYVCQYIIKINE